jgi:hypothetical protein
VLGPSHWLHEISPPKNVYRHFWPDLYTSEVQPFFIEFEDFMDRWSASSFGTPIYVRMEGL